MTDKKQTPKKDTMSAMITNAEDRKKLEDLKAKKRKADAQKIESSMVPDKYMFKPDQIVKLSNGMHGRVFKEYVNTFIVYVQEEQDYKALVTKKDLNIVSVLPSEEVAQTNTVKETHKTKLNNDLAFSSDQRTAYDSRQLQKNKEALELRKHEEEEQRKEHLEATKRSAQLPINDPLLKGDKTLRANYNKVTAPDTYNAFRARQFSRGMEPKGTQHKEKVLSMPLTTQKAEKDVKKQPELKSTGKHVMSKVVQHAIEDYFKHLTILDIPEPDEILKNQLIRSISYTPNIRREFAVPTPKAIKELSSKGYIDADVDSILSGVDKTTFKRYYREFIKNGRKLGDLHKVELNRFFTVLIDWYEEDLTPDILWDEFQYTDKKRFEKELHKIGFREDEWKYKPVYTPEQFIDAYYAKYSSPKYASISLSDLKKTQAFNSALGGTELGTERLMFLCGKEVIEAIDKVCKHRTKKHIQSADAKNVEKLKRLINNKPSLCLSTIASALRMKRYEVLEFAEKFELIDELNKNLADNKYQEQELVEYITKHPNMEITEIAKNFNVEPLMIEKTLNHLSLNKTLTGLTEKSLKHYFDSLPKQLVPTTTVEDIASFFGVPKQRIKRYLTVYNIDFEAIKAQTDANNK